MYTGLRSETDGHATETKGEIARDCSLLPLTFDRLEEDDTADFGLRANGMMKKGRFGLGRRLFECSVTVERTLFEDG